MEVNVYFNGPATEIDMGPREFSIIPATGPAGADGQPGRDGTIENLDVEAETLPAGSQATATYEDNLLTLGIPEGEQGEDGRGIVSITKQGSSGNIDTYKITYTSGAASTFEVTNGIDTSAIPVYKAAVGSGWSSSTWSSYARSAGAPSGGTCYTNTITVTGATGFDTFVARYMNGFTGVVYATVLDGQVMFETSINPTGQYAIDGILVKGKTSGTLYHTTQYVPGGGGALWGNITGTLSNQTDLQTALNAKADTSAIPTKVSDLTNDAGYITPSDLAMQDISSLYTFTKTSGNVNVTSIGAVRSGNYVMLSIKADYTATTTKGSNVLEGTISGGPLPAVDAINLGSYYGDGGSVVFLTTAGAVTVRAIGGSIGANGYSTTLSIGFLTND